MRRKTIPKQPYSTRGYHVTEHAVYDMNIRHISKGELGENLSKKPRYKSRVTLDTLGRPYYKRFSFNKIFTIINPTNKNVASVRKYHEKEVRREIRKYEKN